MGALAEPIRSHEWHGLLNPSVARGADAIASDEQEKMTALFAHYGVEPTAPDAWQELAYALARVHVPGFRVCMASPLTTHGGFPFLGASPWESKRRRGRPSKAPGLLAELLKQAASTACRSRGRPAKFTAADKRQVVANIEAAFAAAAVAEGRRLSQREAAKIIFENSDMSALRRLRKFKAEIERGQKSEKLSDAISVLQNFGRSK